MTDKTPIGVDFLDSRYGGAFRGRPMLVCGPAKSGKTTAAFHFLRRGLRLRERCLLLTARPAADIVVQADAMGMDFSQAVESGHLILLEYADDVPGRHSESAITLPPDSFMQLAHVVAEQAVARLALDTCLPWVAVKGGDRLEEHVFSFIRSLDRMGLTTLLTMPKAASLASARLYKLIETQVPISVTLDADKERDSRLLIVNKYLGMDDKVGLEIAFDIKPNVGITEGARAERKEPSSAVDAQGQERPVTQPASGIRFSQHGGLRFSADAPNLQNGPGTRQQGTVQLSQDIW
jgi:KaiC/GvpD/RAD55 family RecA-like ATPase